MDVKFDPILGKMREADIGGGTGGGGGTEYSAGTGIDSASLALGTIEVSLTPGFRTDITGATISQKKWFPITTATGNSVTMQPGEAYVITATTAAFSLNTTTIPADNYGLESHLEIFVANTGYIVTGSNVVLANALEPDSVNNCTVRFHDGMAIISVEDHIAGYIVVSATGTASGSLYYGLATASNKYISFDASITNFDLGGVTTSAGEKHVVGNGYAETILSGGINCTSKTTFANLAMNGVVVSSGTLTMGDVYIPNGATVSLAGGAIALENVNGGTIDLGGKRLVSSTPGEANGAIVRNVIITNGVAPAPGGIAYVYSATQNYSSCEFRSNSASGNGGIFRVTTNGKLNLQNCTIADNTNGAIVMAAGSAYISGTTFSNNTNFAISFENYGLSISIDNCTFDDGQYIIFTTGSQVNFSNTNTMKSMLFAGVGSGTVIISSGAIIDLTGNTNATPINPGGGVTVLAGGCQVITSAGATVSIAAGTYTKINNDGTTA